MKRARYMLEGTRVRGMRRVGFFNAGLVLEVPLHAEPSVFGSVV
jgi:hypothetical protein